jgi:hypothetical protein
MRSYYGRMGRIKDRMHLLFDTMYIMLSYIKAHKRLFTTPNQLACFWV